MNRRRRLPQAENLTPQAYRCPACCITARMLVVWPSWVCQVCKTKLVPADLHPRPGHDVLGQPAEDGDIVIEMHDCDAGSPQESPRRVEKETSG